MLSIIPLAVSLLVAWSQPPAADPAAPPPSPLPGLDYTEPFFPNAQHDPNVPSPDSVLGFAVGSRPANHAQIEAVFKAIASKSPRTRLFEYGKTHEGRTLYYMVIASEANIAKLDALKADLARLYDPRTVSAAEGDALAKSLPAVAWMAYVIHGDEMSGSDAALAVAHHLASGTGDDVRKLLDNLIVIIDPLMNPDGRDRWLNMAVQNRTAQPSVDDQSLLHSGFWPSGRMNHYLFDMNRDWIFATQPETRGRLRAISQWHPHYFMESHEMGSQDTFLFMPGREALNPNLPENVTKWEGRFAKEQGEAFDARGWRYYTGEWNDNWYPGYSSSWAALRGIIENLYEQAGIAVDAVRRAEGTLHTYREAVHKQLVSSMANLTTLSNNRAEILADYLAEKRKSVAADGPQARRVFAVIPGGNKSRLARFLDLMSMEGFEYTAANTPFKASGKDRLGRAVADKDFPAGTILIPNRQPLSRLVGAMLEFDPRMTDAFLADERRELLRFNRSRNYDTTAWSLPMLFDVECYEIASPAVDAKAPSTAELTPIANPDTTVGFVIDGADDASLVAAGRLMERGVWVRAAAKPFQFDGRDFSRGSIVVTRKDNPRPVGAPADSLGRTIAEVCTQARVQAVGVRTGMGPGDLPDLGGEHFVLLHQPRIALLARDPVQPYSFGAAWYMIDHVLGLRATYLDARQVKGSDLRRYNVLILPEGSGGILKDGMDDLRAWVEAGGTLIAIGNATEAFAKDGGIGSTRLLPAVLTKPEPFIQAVIREYEGRTAKPDTASVWAFTPPSGDNAVQFPWDGAAENKPSDDEVKRRDDWRKIFMPSGAIVAARIDDRSYLTGGCGEYLPVIYGGDSVLVSPPGVQAAARLGFFSPAPPAPPAPIVEPKKDDNTKDKDKDKKDDKPKPGWTIAPPGQELRLRMSGLLWPEAAERLANTAFLTRESIGNGQIILFASDPNFRAASLGTARLFLNAAVLGPGMGANQPIRP